MDVGGDHIGARAIGGYAPKLNKDNTIVYYVLNAYRPWSNDIDHIDGTLGQILGVSHIQLGKLHMVNNRTMESPQRQRNLSRAVVRCLRW